MITLASAAICKNGGVTLRHSGLKNKIFEDIQALYEKVKRFDESFTAVGSTEDERRIKEMNEESDVDSDDEHRKCLKIVTFEGTMDSEI
ncbi:hypothetical protein Tco_0479990, partial [Tanacetum coccineum]